jgi:methionyl aminopeptidase
MIIIKTQKEIEIMRRGGKILAAILREIAKKAVPGATTGELEELAIALIKKNGGRPSFKGYKSMLETKAFPTALCTSINHEVVHAPALPPRELKTGDIIGIDIGMEHPYGQNLRGYYTDMAVTVGVGRVRPEAKRLIKNTEKCLKLAIKNIKPGNTLNDIGAAIQACAQKSGFSVVKDLVGHGVGTAVHEEPQIPNYPIYDRGFDNVVLKPGMVLAIEPMVNAGVYQVRSLPDGFTIVTADGRLSAHFEHTVAITEKGCEVLTI